MLWWKKSVKKESVEIWDPTGPEWYKTHGIVVSDIQQIPRDLKKSTREEISGMPIAEADSHRVTNVGLEDFPEISLEKIKTALRMMKHSKWTPWRRQ